MDPISAFFASIVDVTSNSIMQTYADATGMQLQSLVVNHDGIPVPYSYQLWQIKPDSVCHSYRNTVQDYSRCTVAAKAMFTQACQELQAKPSRNAQHTKLQNMYCMASMTYQPTIANISWSGGSSALDEARTACNAAIAGQVGNPDPAARQRKKAACDQYDALKAAQ
jgi:hypothetical protein